MKKTILLFTFVTLFLFSCSSNDGKSTSTNTTTLSGTWLFQSATLNGNKVSSSGKVQFTNKKRAYYTYFKYGINGQDITENADYSLNGNTLTVTYDESDPGNETDTFLILELTTTKLKVKSVDDEGTLIETYVK